MTTKLVNGDRTGGQTVRRRRTASHPALRRLAVLAAAAVALWPAACSGGDDAKDAGKKKGPSATAAPAPSAKMSPTKVLSADLSYSDFDRIVVASGLGKDLDSAKELTLLVPSNEGLKALGDGAVDRLVANHAAAEAFVKSRAIDAKLSVTDLLNRTEPITDEAGTVWKAAVVDSRPTVGGATVGPQDIPMRNGFLHVIDAPGDQTKP